MAVMGQLGNGCKERTKEEREKKFLVQSGQVLGTSSLVASSQLFSNEGLGTRF